MSNTEHLDDQAMVQALNHLHYQDRRVILANCQNCGTPLLIAGVMRRYRRLLPYSPNRGPWRAFERDHARRGHGFRSSKAHGFVPNHRDDVAGFPPHDCPLADWRQQEEVS